MLLGPDGSALSADGEYPAGARRVKSFDLAEASGPLSSALFYSRRQPSVRAANPMAADAWSFAAMRAIRDAVAAAPFTIYRDTPDDLSAAERLRTKSLDERLRGASSAAEAARIRRAYRREILWRSQRWRRNPLGLKGLAPDFDHELNDLLDRPNPNMRRTALFQFTALSLALDGEAFWLPLDASASVNAAQPSQLWPIRASAVKLDPSGNRWLITVPRWIRDQIPGMPNYRSVSFDEVIHFKTANPADAQRGWAPLTAAALGLELDMLAQDHQRSLIENGAVPSGLITTDLPLDERRQQKLKEDFQSRHSGPANSGSTVVMSGGLKYVPLELSSREMEYLDMRRWNREERLAALGTPQSVLGLTEVSNYTNKLTQLKTFWELTVLPLLNLIADEINATLLAPIADDVFGAFDLSGVEALRAGIDERVAIAERLSGGALHLPPKDAFALVGLDAPDYVGNDVALVPAGLVPAEAALVAEAPPTPAESGGPKPALEPPAKGVRSALRDRAARRLRRAALFLRLQSQQEGAFRRAYRAWVAADRADTLKRLDAEARRSGLKLAARAEGRLNLTAVLPDPKKSSDALRSRVRPNYAHMLDAVYGFTLEDLGIPTFPVDDERLLAFFDRHETLFASKTPEAVRRNLARALSDGIARGETVQQLRARVAAVYDVAASSAKSLAISRTTTASFLNGERWEMFGAQGIDEQDWVTAGDEHVRPDHVLFGDAGPRARGFDYLSLVGAKGSGGSLLYPGDLNAPAAQVFNCRCLLLPA